MDAVNVSEAKSRFSELVSRAAAGERIVIQRRERPVAILLSPHEVERLDRSGQLARRLAEALGQDAALLRRIEAGDLHPAMAAFGLWRDETELADLAEEIRLNRKGQPRREVQL